MAGKKPEKQIVTLARLEVQYVPIDAVHPNDYNPNRQDDDEFQLLLKSIQEDGFTQPVVCRPDDTPQVPGFPKTWTIVDGFHRWKAGKTLGYKECPIVETNMTEVQARIATLRHNRARGQEDVQLLSDLMKDFEKLGAMEWASDSLDMSDEEISRLMSYGDSILDHFPGEAPSQAWEPRQTLPGQVQVWTDPNANIIVSASQGAQVPPSGADAGERPDRPTVPGLGKAADYAAPAPGSYVPPTAMPAMARRIFLLNEEECRIVDQVLGQEQAKALVQLCKEKLGIE